jgi:hypothetical protein
MILKMLGAVSNHNLRFASGHTAPEDAGSSSCPREAWAHGPAAQDGGERAGEGERLIQSTPNCCCDGTAQLTAEMGRFCCKSRLKRLPNSDLVELIRTSIQAGTLELVLSDECTLLGLCKVSRKLLPSWLKSYP